MMAMKHFTYLTTLFMLVLSGAELVAAPTTWEILRKADQARGNMDGVTWEVRLESRENSHTNTMTLDVKARGFEVLGVTLAPAKYKDNKTLMLHDNSWFYKPGLSKPVPISRRQRLLGHASYGDIASTNYANDYEATSLPDEAVDGTECYVFDLKALDSKKTTYDRIKYWISKDRLVGIKAEYFTVSGKKFKMATMEYKNHVEISGVTQPFISQIAIYDELMSSDVTTLSFNNPQIQTLPNYIFNLNLLVR
jgi:Outer membrane lipoprotein-sorting protein